MDRIVTFGDWCKQTIQECDEWLMKNEHVAEYEIEKRWYEGWRAAIIAATAKYIELGPHITSMPLLFSAEKVGKE